MALNVITPVRARPVPKSPIVRNNRLMALLADCHDGWLARKHAAAAQQELCRLDDRILRDIGLNHAVLEEITRDRKQRERPGNPGFLRLWRKLHNSAPFRTRSRPSGSQY